MPLELKPPRQGKTPYYYIRGTYLGFTVNRTTGTADRAKARKALNAIKRDIERGAYAEKPKLGFSAAALSYVRAGGEDKFLLPLVEHFKDTPLDEIDQPTIDEAAALLYPDASPATKNRQVYTPISAILKHVGYDYAIKRPKGAQGEERTDWLWPEQAEALFKAATEVDSEFGAFLVLLTYCGPRLSEALRITCDDLRLGESFAYCGRTKNGSPRPMHLPPVVVAALANHPRGVERGQAQLFRFRKNGHLYNLMADTREKAALPLHVTFHTLRHTYGTWMRRYGGLDTRGLVGTGAWRNEKSAARYAHVVVSEEARRSDLLPMQIRGQSVENGN